MKITKKGTLYFTSETEKEGYERTPLFLQQQGEKAPFTFFPNLGTLEEDIYFQYARKGAKEKWEDATTNEKRIVNRFGGLDGFRQWYDAVWEKMKKEKHTEGGNAYRYA